MGFTPCKAELPLWGMKLQEKDEEKDKKQTGKLFRKNLLIKGSVNSRLKAISIIGQRKAFHRQGISESSCIYNERNC